MQLSRENIVQMWFVWVKFEKGRQSMETLEMQACRCTSDHFPLYVMCMEKFSLHNFERTTTKPCMNTSEVCVSVCIKQRSHWMFNHKAVYINEYFFCRGVIIQFNSCNSIQVIDEKTAPAAIVLNWMKEGREKSFVHIFVWHCECVFWVQFWYVLFLFTAHLRYGEL